MTSRQRFFKTFQFEETDRPPHFELHFELQKEAFGLDFPMEEEWQKLSQKNKNSLYNRCAEIYKKTVEEFNWDAVAVYNPAYEYDFFPFLKSYLDNDFPVGSMVWWSSISIETVNDFEQFAVDLYEKPREMHKWATDLLKNAKERAQKLIDVGCDFIVVPSDVAHNKGTFLSPKHFAEFTAPYLKELFYFIQKQSIPVIYHTDGNLMEIMDQLFEMAPDGLQSIDPMAGMDIAEVKKLTYGKIVLMGNVNCSYLQDGPKEKIIESAKYALDFATKGGGYIFSSSNTIFKGVPLKNYKIMLNYFHDRFSIGKEF